MFNAMNALSSSGSLLTLPLWKNMMLVYAIALSMALHFALLYIPFLQGLFAIVPLNLDEWKAVLVISLPVMYVTSFPCLSLPYPRIGRSHAPRLIDEVLKFVERQLYLRKPLMATARPKKD